MPGRKVSSIRSRARTSLRFICSPAIGALHGSHDDILRRIGGPMAAHPGEITDFSDKREDAPVAKVARAEPAVDDLHEVAAAEPAPVDEDAVRVPTAYEA